MPDKAKCELVLIVDANGDYGSGRDFDAAKENYEADVGELSSCEGGFRVVRLDVAVPLPEVVELTGKAPGGPGLGEKIIGRSPRESLPSTCSKGDRSMQTTETESVSKAADLEAALRKQGFRPGFPPHIAPMARAVDQSAARRMKCPGCGSRMRGSKAFHKPGGYKLLAICPCGCAEEV